MHRRHRLKTPGASCEGLLVRSAQEPLRAQMQVQVREALSAASPAEIDLMVLHIVHDNLELGCQVIAKTAKDKVSAHLSHPFLSSHIQDSESQTCLVSKPIRHHMRRCHSSVFPNIRNLHIMMFPCAQAFRDLEEHLSNWHAARRSKSQGHGPGFYDASAYNTGNLGRIPEALRPKPGHLTAAQLRVYEVTTHGLFPFEAIKEKNPASYVWQL